MDAGETMRRLRFALGIDDIEAQRLMVEGGETHAIERVVAWRLRPGQDGHAPCPPTALAALLDGLVTDRRGRLDDPGGSPPGRRASARAARAPIDNNHVLKSLRIALELQSDDMRHIIELGGGSVGSSEIGAFMRKPGTRNYRPCGDQVLRRFLKGLAMRERPDHAS